MSDLISKRFIQDALIEKISSLNAEGEIRTAKELIRLKKFVDGLTPSAEPKTEVVRCKDCKYWQDNNGGYPNQNCRWNEQETPDADDFCSAGERRENE